LVAQTFRTHQACDDSGGGGAILVICGDVCVVICGVSGRWQWWQWWRWKHSMVVVLLILLVLVADCCWE
jgi:hypothetical protein